MRLSEIAEKVGVPVVDLSQKSISQAVKDGRITKREGKDLSAELKKADEIWANPIKGVPVAESLW